MTETGESLTTLLRDLHLSLGARMVSFAGYDMPVQYPPGILKEHLWTRSSAGLFDVSHMGQITVRVRSGGYEDAALAVESLVPINIFGLTDGRQRYGFFTGDTGGILDDLMIAHVDDRLFVIVNASRKADDLRHLQNNIEDTCEVTLFDRALIALQGPHAADVLAGLSADIAGMQFMDVRECSIDGVSCLVSRSDYSGEDGFEMSVPADRVGTLAKMPASHRRRPPLHCSHLQAPTSFSGEKVPC